MGRPKKSLKKEAGKLLRKKGVVGYYIGKQKNGKRTKEEVITVFVEKKIPEAQLLKRQKIPGKIHRTRTDVVEIGKLTDESQDDLSSRLRPVKVGCSIGNKATTATGTLGPIFRDEPFMELFYGGSNSHVLFENCFKDIKDQKSKGIIQPGRVHDNSNFEANRIGTLIQGTKLNSGGMNSRDSALFIFSENEDVDPTIPEIGIPLGVKELQEGEIGRLKSWRQEARGKLTYKNATVRVSYSNGTVTFTGVDLFENISSPGCSGSTILTEDGKWHSHLLFAGSPSVSVGIPFNRAWSVYDKVPVTKTWWEGYKNKNGGGNGGGDNGNETPKPPEPPIDWSLGGGGAFLFAMGIYLISTYNGRLEIMGIGIILTILGLAAVVISSEYRIQKKIVPNYFLTNEECDQLSSMLESYYPSLYFILIRKSSLTQLEFSKLIRMIEEKVKSNGNKEKSSWSF